ncbi:uncharacterized protein si:dkey-10o6.2 [Trichomycterus rosablanca]|uniref:uncharacterized protein si:dkey-10o6.2 n=1 Tax=Trichomycterus rosablanca TaxID=2290929 RepID=UPI002F353D38
MLSIPVIDFGVYKLGTSDIAKEDLQKISRELQTAFEEVGFVYLKNTGIDQKEVERVLDVSKKFFLLPEEQKSSFKRGSYDINVNHGWVSSETESLNPRRPGDLKEAFNITSISENIKWPTGLRATVVEFFLHCRALSLRVLKVMAFSLGVDPEVFLETHRFIGSKDNDTTLRSLYYPSVNPGIVKKDQLRCGEHSDYGSITLLFQGNEEGLQVQGRKGEFISAPSIPGAVLVNIADLMQRWTSDKFVSAVHRVLLPPPGDVSTRQSLAFFVHPDNEALITCFDGLNKYPPVTALNYLLSRFEDTY